MRDYQAYRIEYREGDGTYKEDLILSTNRKAAIEEYEKFYKREVTSINETVIDDSYYRFLMHQKVIH